MNHKFPADTLCCIEGCGHRFDDHKPGAFPDVPGPCRWCEENANRGFDVPGKHVFRPRVLAGGALNPSQEHDRYLKAMRGE